MGFWKSVGRALAESATAQAARDQQKAARKETAAYLAAMAAAGAERSKGKRKKLFEQALTLKAKADAKTEAADRAGLAAAHSRQQRAAEFGAHLDARAQAETNPSKRDRLLRSASFVRNRAGIPADSVTAPFLEVPAAPVVDPMPASTPVVRPRNCPNCGAPTSATTTNVCRYCGVDLPGRPAPDAGVTIPPSAAQTQIDPTPGAGSDRGTRAEDGAPRYRGRSGSAGSS
jgi:hypothetical protein